MTVIASRVVSNTNNVGKELWRKAASQGDFFFGGEKKFNVHWSTSATNKRIGAVAYVRAVGPVRVVAFYSWCNWRFNRIHHAGGANRQCAHPTNTLFFERAWDSPLKGISMGSAIFRTAMHPCRARMVQSYLSGGTNVHPQLIRDSLGALSCKQHLVRSSRVEGVNGRLLPNFEISWTFAEDGGRPRNFMAIGQNSKHCWYDDFAICSKWRPYAILILLCPCLDYPGGVFGGVYHCAKIGWNRCSSFDNMQLLIFNEFGLKMLIHAPKMEVLVNLTPKYWAAFLRPLAQKHVIQRVGRLDRSTSFAQLINPMLYNAFLSAARHPQVSFPACSAT